MKLLATLTALVLSFASTAHADVTVPKVFSSHMVLQRNLPIHIWGQANPGEQVTVALGSASATATADTLHRWSVYLPARSAGGPFTLTIKATNTLTLDDILIGDLWLASGQSNMEMPLKGFNPDTPIKDSAREIAAANYPQIRLLLVKKDTADFPLEDIKAADGWSLCTPESAANFSAVAYFFARDLQQKEHVPIGLIDSTWGGTPAEAWTSLDALASDAALMPVFATYADRANRESTEQELDALADQAKAEGKPGRNHHPNLASWRPAGLYNAMIAPFTPLPIRGVIWYQGESNGNAQMAPLYGRLFPAMIQDWRARWHQANLPFLFVQLAAYDAGVNPWGILREGQRSTLRLANTGMAVTIDVGEQHNIHPANKQATGNRLSLLARSISYDEAKLVASGPLFRYAYPVGNTMHVIFDNAAGLKSSGAPTNFEVAGADGVFNPATATIEGDAIVATSPAVPTPRYVRYAWASYPVNPNLYNAADLPASPFSSYSTP